MGEETFERIKEIVSWVWRHPTALFYRKKYAGRGYDPETDLRAPGDWQTVPFVQKRELEEAPRHYLLFLPFKEGVYITYTAGTTRARPLAIFRANDPEERCWAWLKTEPLRSAKTMLVVMMPYLILKYYPLAIRQGLMPVMGNIHDLAASAYLAALFNTDLLHTLPTIALRAAPHFQSLYDPRRFKAISMVGEKLTKTKRALLREYYPEAHIYSYFSTSETGTIGYQCQAINDSAEGNAYHFAATKLLPEIIDAQTLEPLALTEEGELVLTTLQKVPTPLIRYRTGDRVVFDHQPCPCGDPQPIFHAIGRAGFDVIKTGGFELRLESFEDAVRALAHLLEFEFQVLVTEVFDQTVIKPKILWRVLPRRPDMPEKEKILISRTLKETTRLSAAYTIAQAQTAGLLLPLEVEFVREFPGSYKTPRLRLVELPSP